jgi:hypothetical protein
MKAIVSAARILHHLEGGAAKVFRPREYCEVIVYLIHVCLGFV